MDAERFAEGVARLLSEWKRGDIVEGEFTAKMHVLITSYAGKDAYVVGLEERVTDLTLMLGELADVAEERASDDSDDVSARFEQVVARTREVLG